MRRCVLLDENSLSDRHPRPDGLVPGVLQGDDMDFPYQMYHVRNAVRKVPVPLAAWTLAWGQRYRRRKLLPDMYVSHHLR